MSDWISRPHLERSESGRAALAAYDGLSDPDRARVDRLGARLATSSAAAANALFLQLEVGFGDFDDDALDEWLRQGERLLAEALASREAAGAYFRVPVASLLAAPGLAAAWIDAAHRLIPRSKRLAAAFVVGTADLFASGGLEVDAAQRLRAWADAADRVADTGDWRGELVAVEMLGAAEKVLPRLRAGEIADWAAVGRRVQGSRHPDRRAITSLPEQIDILDDDERASLLAACAVASEHAPEAAVEVFRELPAVLATLEPPARHALVDVIRAAAPAIAELAGVTHVLAAIVSSPREVDRLPLLAAVETLASDFPECAVDLLRALPRLVERADRAGIEEWIAQGRRVADEDPAAGRAFFSLHSRTADRALRHTSTAVLLDEVRGLLRRVARMFAGREIDLYGEPGRSLRPFVDVESLARESLTLPESVQLFTSWEENFALLEFLTLQGVGRILHGSFEIALADVAKRLPRPLADFLPGDEAPADLVALLQSLPAGDSLPMLFASCEGARVDARLCREYRGYRADLRRVAEHLSVAALGRGHDLWANPELLFFLLGAGVPAPRLAAEPSSQAAPLLNEVAALLLSPESTAADALALALQLRERLAATLPAAAEAGNYSWEDLLFGELAGELMYDDLAEPAPGAGADERAEEGVEEGAAEMSDAVPQSVEETDEEMGGGSPLSADEIRELLEAGAVLKLGKEGSEVVESGGLYATGLPSSSAGETEELSGEVSEGTVLRSAARGERLAEYEYDEWDYGIRDYRKRWCRLVELGLEGDAGEFFQEALERHSDLLPEVRRQFQRIRPERYRRIRGLEDGEDFDLNAVVEARTELRARRTPSSRLYTARRREERDVATLFLLDMSASTDESLPTPEKATADRRDDDPYRVDLSELHTPAHRHEKERRVIDVLKESLVVMAEALEEIGDQYAILGFSGEGRRQVEVYPAKSFREGLSATVRGRIGGIEPRRSTRMGTAIRHAMAKLQAVASRSKHIILLSDGFPQDFDYGEDRRSNVFGIQDTMTAIQECQAVGISPFCITVDKAGHDYLRQMCETSRYMVIDDVASLPAELPKIYERWVRG